MLKTVSSIANAIGSLNYKGTWDANANSPMLTSSVGTKGDYYVIVTAGTTSLNGIGNWGIGDWTVFNGSVWQRVEGGADLNGVNLSVTGTSTLDGNVTFKDNLTQGTAAKGVNFTANTPVAGMTSQLLNAYEEGTWTPVVTAGTGSITSYTATGTYTRVGRQITLLGEITITNAGTGSTFLLVAGLPFGISGILLSGAGREIQLTGQQCSVSYSSGSSFSLNHYNNNNIVVANYKFSFLTTYFV